MYAAMCALTVAFVAIWVPETKGKTLEEIQYSFRWSWSWDLFTHSLSIISTSIFVYFKVVGVTMVSHLCKRIDVCKSCFSCLSMNTKCCWLEMSVVKQSWMFTYLLLIYVDIFFINKLQMIIITCAFSDSVSRLQALIFLPYSKWEKELVTNFNTSIFVVLNIKWGKVSI